MRALIGLYYTLFILYIYIRIRFSLIKRRIYKEIYLI